MAKTYFMPLDLNDYKGDFKIMNRIAIFEKAEDSLDQAENLIIEMRNMTLVDFSEKILGLKLTSVEKELLKGLSERKSVKIDTKKCCDCKKEKPATEDFFYKNRGASDGLQTMCKKCQKIRNDLNRLKTKEKYIKIFEMIEKENRKLTLSQYLERVKTLKKQVESE